MSQAPVVETTVQVPPATAQNIEHPAVVEQTIPYARFKEVNDALAELRRKDAERETREKSAAEQRAKEQGQWEKLASDRETELATLKPQVETTTARAQALEEVMEKQIKERAKALPEELRAMMPDGDVLAQFAWLGKAEIAAQKLVIQRSPGTPVGPSGIGVTAPPVGDVVAQKRASADYSM